MIVRSFLPSLSSSCSSNFTRGATISSITTVYIFRTSRTLCPPLYERTSGGYSSFSPVCRLPRFASRNEQTYRSSAHVPLTVRSFVGSFACRFSPFCHCIDGSVPYAPFLPPLPLSAPSLSIFSDSGSNRDETRSRTRTNNSVENVKVCVKRTSVMNGRLCA